MYSYIFIYCIYLYCGFFIVLVEFNSAEYMGCAAQYKASGLLKCFYSPVVTDVCVVV